MTDIADGTARAELLMSAARLALAPRGDGDPERILQGIAHPSLNRADVHRYFATLIESVGALRALRPYTPDGDDSALAAFDHEIQRGVLAAVLLIFGEPTIDNTLTDAESEAAA